MLEVHFAVSAVGPGPAPSLARLAFFGNVDRARNQESMLFAMCAVKSFKLLAPGGSLIAYGNAGIADSHESLYKAFAKFMVQLTVWNLLPNSHYATFFNFWAGSRVTPKAFRRRLSEDLAALLDLLSKGAIAPGVAARFRLPRRVPR